MSTLVAVSGLGVICLLLEILNLRKILVPVTLLGLAGILGMSIAEVCIGEPFITDTHNMIVSTPFSQGFSILFVVLALLIIAVSPKFYEDKINKIADYVAIKVFILAGAVAMVSFGNLAMFFIGLEVLSIGAYVLAASDPKSLRSNEAGMKYFIMGAFASSFILFGIALIYGATGSFFVADMPGIDLGLPVWFYIGFAMIFVGLLFKASIFPFHFWAPDVYEGSPAIVSALMSTLIKVAAIGALCKMCAVFGIAKTPMFNYSVIVLSIMSMSVGNITALKQRNIKRMMAYSGISHAGFMIMPLLITGIPSPNVVLYYAAAYALAGVAAFSVIMAVCKDKENEDISNFYGLARRKPILAAAMAGALMSLGGIPVFAGFFAKFFVFEAMLEIDQLLLVIFGIINSVIAVFYYFGVINVMFTKENEDKEPLRVPNIYVIVAVVAILLNIVLGVFPSIIMG